ncbi:MAG: TolC family protein [Chitinophagaceae bacterium]
MKNLLIICYLLGALYVQAGESQGLKLEEAYDMAIRNYPLTKQKDLIARTAGLNLENIASVYLPQVSLNAQATYQSDVTRFPKQISIPGVEISALSRDQYRAMLDVNQLIYDGGNASTQRLLAQQQQKVDEQRIEVSYQQLRERINDIWFSVLFADEQLQQIALTQKDLMAVMAKVESQVNYGTAFRSALATLKAEQLKNEQRAIDLKYNRRALIRVLSVFLGQDLSPDVKLERPAMVTVDTTAIRRPDLELLNRQIQLNEVAARYLNVRKVPKVSLFAQGGYGKPGLNMLLNEFDFFYLGGVRFSWNLSGFYNQGRDKQLNELNRQTLLVQQEQVMFQVKADLLKNDAEMEKYRELDKTDEEIIALRQQVKQASAAQLEQGVITSSDYVREVNAEEQARLSQALHRLQLLQAVIHQKTLIGQ